MSWLDPFFNAASIILQNAGLSLPARARMNFAAPLTATDNPGADATDIGFDGTVPAAPGADALVLQSTGASSTAWRPVAPTLVPSGGSDYAQIAAGLAAAGHVALSVGTFNITANATIGTAAAQALHIFPGAMLKPASGVHILLVALPDVQPGQAWIDLSAGGTISIASGGYGPTIVHPDWFVGCDRTGSADSSAAFQAAHDMLPDEGGIIDLLVGYYKLSNVSITKNGVKVRGAQRFATTILDASATANLFSLTSCALVDIEDLEIRRPLLSDVKTAGVTFNLSNCTNIGIRRIRLTSPFQGIHVSGGGEIRVDDVHVLPSSTAATWSFIVKLENTAGVVLRGIDVNMGNNVTVSTALLLIDGGCDTILVTDCSFAQVGTNIGSYGDPYPTTGGTCVLLQNSNASFDPRWIHLVNVVTEAINGPGFDISAANQVRAFGCTVQTSLIGIRVTGGNDLVFIGGFVNQIQEHGIQLTGGERIAFQGYEVTACSRELTNTYSGFSVGGTAQDVHVIGAAIGDTETLGAVGYSMAYGIAQSAGGSDDDADHLYRENVFGPLCTATVFRGVAKVDYGTRFEAEGTAAPAGGTWARGDVVHALTPSDGGPAGWICTVAGTPGTWVPWYVHAVAPTSAATANAPVIRDSSAGAAFAALTATGVTVSGLTASQAVVTDGSKNLASLAYTSAATASTITSRDANGDVAFHQGNFSAGIIVTGSTQLPGNGLLRAGAAGAAILVWRRSDNGGDVAGIVIDGSNNMIIGDSTGADGTTILDGKVVRLRDPAQATALQISANKNISLFSTGSFGSGQGVVSGANATTAPSGDPTGGGIYYWSGGALMHRGSSGTVTTVAPA